MGQPLLWALLHGVMEACAILFTLCRSRGMDRTCIDLEIRSSAAFKAAPPRGAGTGALRAPEAGGFAPLTPASRAYRRGPGRCAAGRGGVHPRFARVGRCRVGGQGWLLPWGLFPLPVGLTWQERW